MAEGELFPALACVHKHVESELMLRNSVHFGKRICTDCGKFLGWVKKPQTVHREAMNAFKLSKLAMQEDLTEWERHFVRSLAKQNKFSPKQQKALLDIYARRFPS